MRTHPRLQNKASVHSEVKLTRMVVCLTGMPGAGKSTAAEDSEAVGFKVFRMGDDVRMEVQKRKLAPTDENLGAIMLQLRQAGGPVAIASLCKQRIEKNSKSRHVVIDGVRNMNEFLEFKKLGSVVLVSIHAPPLRRFKFLQARGRSDSPRSFESFEARDRRELSVGIGEAIALADEIIINSGSIEGLKNQLTLLLKKLKKGD
ncbi:MAG: AAA family ATPase [Nitrososphaerales archaeon]